MTTATSRIETPAPGAYRLDAGESTISFTTRHLFGLAPVHGTFPLRDGQLHVAERLDESSVRARIAADGVDTGVAMRDATVRSAQYLDAERHPDITFVSTGLSQQDGQWVLRGTLTVRGATRPLDVPIEEVRVTGTRLLVRASSVVDRYEWGVTAMKGMTGRRLAFRLALVAVQPPAMA